VALLPAGFSKSFQDLSAVVIIIDRVRISNMKQQTYPGNLTLYMATSLSFTESFFMSRKQKTEFKKPSTGCCFHCESEFLHALAIFKQRISDFALAIFKQNIPIFGWFYNSTFKIFF